MDWGSFTIGFATCADPAAVYCLHVVKAAKASHENVADLLNEVEALADKSNKELGPK